MERALAHLRATAPDRDSLWSYRIVTLSSVQKKVIGAQLSAAERAAWHKQLAAVVPAWVGVLGMWATLVCV